MLKTLYDFSLLELVKIYGSPFVLENDLAAFEKIIFIPLLLGVVSQFQFICPPFSY